MDDDRPATKKDLDNLKTELSTEFKTDLVRVQDTLVETMRDMQTELLRAFQAWQESVIIRFRNLEAPLPPVA
jgi:hypothetical protein